MVSTDQAACQQAVLNARSLHIRYVIDNQLSQDDQIMMMYGYHLERAHLSDADEYWPQDCKYRYDSVAHAIGPSCAHIEFLSATMSV
jgi:hypothetical protein